MAYAIWHAGHAGHSSDLNRYKWVNFVRPMPSGWVSLLPIGIFYILASTFLLLLNEAVKVHYGLLLTCDNCDTMDHWHGNIEINM